jgi:hypothetical protein
MKHIQKRAKNSCLIDMSHTTSRNDMKYCRLQQSAIRTTDDKRLCHNNFKLIGFFEYYFLFLVGFSLSILNNKFSFLIDNAAVFLAFV